MVSLIRSPLGNRVRVGLDRLFWPASRRHFLEQLSRVESIQDTIEMAWTYRGRGFYRNIMPNQDRWEITRAAQRIQGLNPRVIVEIGTRHGGTLFIWAQAAQQAELIVSIDLPGGIHGGGYVMQRTKLYELFGANKPGCQLELLRADSQTAATRAQLVELLAGRPIDFLFIDGDHRYPGVSKDYELYADLVRPDGLIGFHDIRPNPRNKTIEVYRLWDEIKAEGAQVEEIINEPYQGRYGIGLLHRSNEWLPSES